MFWKRGGADLAGRREWRRWGSGLTEAGWALGHLPQLGPDPARLEQRPGPYQTWEVPTVAVLQKRPSREWLQEARMWLGLVVR